MGWSAPLGEVRAFFTEKLQCHIYERVGAPQCNVRDEERGSDSLNRGIVRISVGCKYRTHCAYVCVCVSV